MYAIVDVGGKQFKVSENDTIEVPLLGSEEGKTVELKNVVLLSKDGAVTVGAPHVDKAIVSATVVGTTKGPKLIVYKMKRRKGSHTKNGHRQKYTKIQINKISA